MGRSWRRLGALLAPLGPLLAPSGALLASILAFGGLLWDLFGTIFRAPLENSENLKNLDFSMVVDGFGPPRGSKIEPKWVQKSLLPASWQLLALTWRFSALSWRLWAASWRSWRLLGASWGALVAILAPRENLAIMEREARSQRELQALQAANNKACLLYTSDAADEL